MPHTNRRKKKAPTKRLEVADEDGWTRVTTTDRNQRAPKAHSSLPLHLHSSGPAQVESGMTLDKIKDEYSKIEDQWLASQSHTSLRNVLTKQVLLDGLEFDKCLIFGSASFCGVFNGWISRKTAALCQLAILMSISRTIESITGQAPPLYAQDPVYNDLDREFLSTMAVTVTDTPQGFDMITNQSLVYAPCAEVQVEMSILKQNPAALLVGRLNWFWRNQNGQACTNRTFDDSGKTTEEVNAPQDRQNENKDGLLTLIPVSNLERGCQVFENFLQRKQEARLPDFDCKDNPFREQCLYWPQAGRD